MHWVLWRKITAKYKNFCCITQKCYHFDDICVTCYTGSCQNGAASDEQFVKQHFRFVAWWNVSNCMRFFFIFSANRLAGALTSDEKLFGMGSLGTMTVSGVTMGALLGAVTCILITVLIIITYRYIRRRRRRTKTSTSAAAVPRQSMCTSMTSSRPSMNTIASSNSSLDDDLSRSNLGFEFSMFNGR